MGDVVGMQVLSQILSDENIASHGIIHVFDSTDLELIQRNTILADWDSILDKPLALHGGGTPLYDAVNLMVRRLAELDPPKCSIVIITDGIKNGSDYTTPDQARNLLDLSRHKAWLVTFPGPAFTNP